MTLRSLLAILTISLLTAAAYGASSSDSSQQRYFKMISDSGYQYAGNRLLSHGDRVYFVGKQMRPSKYPTAKQVILCLDLASETVEECVPREEFNRHFPDGVHTREGCFEINPLGTLLAVGNTVLRTNDDCKVETQIYLVDLRYEEITLLTDGGFDNRHYHFSPNGRWLLFSRRQPEAEPRESAMKPVRGYGVCLADVDKLNVIVLKPIPKEREGIFGNHFSAAWSPDSRHVVFEYDPAFLKLPTEIVVCATSDFRTQTLLKVSLGVDKISFVDEERFVAAKSGRVDLVNITTGKSRSLVTLEGKFMRGFEIQADSLKFITGPSADPTLHDLPIPPQ